MVFPLHHRPPLTARSPRLPRALTLMELLIALAITACVSAVLAILINATAVGTSSTQDGRRSLVKMQGMKAKIEDTILNARCVLATGSNYLVLWTGDKPGAPTPVNGAVNLSELELIEVDTSTGNLNLYMTTWPSNFSNANIISADQTYAANSSWYSACQSAKTGGYFAPTLLATSVTAMTVSLDSATVTSGRLVSLVINFNDAGALGMNARQLVLASAIRNPAVPW